MELFLVVGVITFLLTLSSYLIAKLATEPLLRYINQLQLLSSQTLHELNLPIATIKTNLSLLQKKLTEEKMLKRLDRIYQATQMLQERYNELDYLIKTQTTKEAIKEEFDIKTFLEERIVFLQSIYPSANIELQAQHKKIVSDKIGLAKVVDNLIDNSVKYSPKDSKIKVIFQDNSLFVIDEGKGIEDVELIRIFDSYYQEDNSTKGFGIGLSLVKHFCDTNNIELQIRSKVMRGTTVELRFKG